MPDIWDVNIRNMRDTGDLYAYAFGVTQAIIKNLGDGLYGIPKACDRMEQLRQDVEMRVDQLYQQAQAKLELTQHHEPRATFTVPDAPVTAIYVTDENADEE